MQGNYCRQKNGNKCEASLQTGNNQFRQQNILLGPLRKSNGDKYRLLVL